MEMNELDEAAKRMADIVSMHAVVGHYGKWAAFALADGRSDTTAYDTRDEAIRHQHHNEDRYTFILIPPSGMTAKEGKEVLSFWRAIRDAGYKAADPQIAMPHSRRDRARQVHAIRNPR